MQSFALNFSYGFYDLFGDNSTNNLFLKNTFNSAILVTSFCGITCNWRLERKTIKTKWSLRKQECFGGIQKDLTFSSVSQ